MDETEKEELRELDELKRKIEGHEEYIKKQRFPYKFFIFLIFVGVMLGTVYFLGYWPDLVKLVNLMIDSSVEAYRSIVSGAQKLQQA